MSAVDRRHKKVSCKRFGEKNARLAGNRAKSWEEDQKRALQAVTRKRPPWVFHRETNSQLKRS